MSSYRDPCDMDRKEMKDAVINELTIGRKYQVVSRQSDEKRSTFAKCRLIAFSRNFAVFEHKNGLKETFTYQELWTQLLAGEIKRL